MIGFLFKVSLLLMLLAPIEIFSAEKGYVQPCLEPEEAMLIEFINQARSDPTSTARDLGMDLENLFEQRPEMEFLLQQELPRVMVDQMLCRSAYNHSSDMLEHGFYSHEGLDGTTPRDRALKQGYYPFTIVEELGLAGFRNYIGPEQASAALFSQIFLNELKSGDFSRPVLLNPVLRDTGAGIAKGFVQLDSFAGNAYISTVNLASQETVMVEQFLRRRINDVRLDPDDFKSLSDVVSEKHRERLQEAAEVLPEKMSPVALNAGLTDMARAMCLQLFQEYQEYDVDGYIRDGFQYDAATGTENLPDFESRVLVIPVEQEATPEDLADKAFADLLEDELDAIQKKKPFILNSDFTVSGIGVFPFEYAGQDHLLLKVLLAGHKGAHGYLTGQIVFRGEDPADNRVENSKGLLISLDTVNQSSLKGFTVSGPGGFYQMKLPERFHPFSMYDLIVKSSTGERLHSERFYAGRGSQRFDVFIGLSAEMEKSLLD